MQLRQGLAACKTRGRREEEREREREGEGEKDPLPIWPCTAFIFSEVTQGQALSLSMRQAV